MNREVWRETAVINVSVSYRHMNRSWNMCMYPPSLTCSRLFPWCAHAHARLLFLSLISFLLVCQRKLFLECEI